NAGGNGYGGGLYNSNGPVELSYTKIAENSSVGGAGNPLGLEGGRGICNTNGNVTLGGVIVANKPAGGNAFGPLTDSGYNLSSDATCAFVAAGSFNNTYPILSPLGDFDGPTPTIALLAGSPAINAGNPASFPPTD